MGLFDKIKEPVFLKENSSAKEQIEKLTAMLPEAPDNIREQISCEIKILSAGVYGEDCINFELKNSHLPMYVIHDLYLSYGDCSAQIDYLIITRNRNFVIECKNLVGNIEVNSSGDFIRTMNVNGKFVKEGIYSPITQNKRHMELMKKIRSDSKSNILTKALAEKFFYENYISVIVLANPKTVLNAKYAKKEIKDQIIRADHLIEFIKKANKDFKDDVLNEKEMENLARFYLNLHQENPMDYTEKYRLMIRGSHSADELTAESGQNAAPKPEASGKILCPKCGAPMVKRTAARGENAGREFWGCSQFPKCRGIVNIK